MCFPSTTKYQSQMISSGASFSWRRGLSRCHICKIWKLNHYWFPCGSLGALTLGLPWSNYNLVCLKLIQSGLSHFPHRSVLLLIVPGANHVGPSLADKGPHRYSYCFVPVSVLLPIYLLIWYYFLFYRIIWCLFPFLLLHYLTAWALVECICIIFW